MNANGAHRSLADHTTLRAGGPARELVFVESREHAVEIARRADRTGRPLLVLGGGSNVVVGDGGFDGTVARMAARGLRIVEHTDDAVVVAAEAGEPWGALVEMSVAEGLAGIECLSGIPGLVGAVPVQNVGAYGQEVAQTISTVQAWDRERRAVVELSAASCGFGYRTSRFRGRDRWVILSVSVRLRRSTLSEPVRHRQLADVLGVACGARAPLRDVRDAVVELRRSKGMVLDAADPDTRSVGSFFTNPVLDADALDHLSRRVAWLSGLRGSLPVFPAAGGRSKVPAGWLVENAGFPRGYTLGPAGVSTKHALALVLHEGTSVEPLLALASHIQARVHDVFGVALAPEPTLVGIDMHGPRRRAGGAGTGPR